VYKKHLNKLKNNSAGKITDSMHNDLLSKNKKAFWKTWKTKMGKKIKSNKTIDGLSSYSDIAAAFADVFKTNCTPNSNTFHKQSNLFFCRDFNEYMIGKNDDYSIEVEIVDKTIREISKNKTPSSDGLSAKHLINAHPCTTIVITRLLNLVMTHEYVPYDFRVSITIPIPKDPKEMVHNKSGNFRGISISTVISKVYEYCLLQKFKSYLRSSHLQFGFKNKTGCTKAIYSVQKTADYFTDG